MVVYVEVVGEFCACLHGETFVYDHLYKYTLQLLSKALNPTMPRGCVNYLSSELDS